MVKQVVVSEVHARYLQNVKNQERSDAGLIIGKTCGNKDYVLRLVSCPSQAVSDAEGTSAAWVAGHAAQVVPTLPGGAEIIGVFIISPSERAKETDVLLKQMIYQSHRLLSKLFSGLEKYFEYHESQLDDVGLFWTAVHANPDGNVISCQQFDVKDNKDVGRPAEWKQFDNTTRWDCLRTQILIDHSIFCSDQYSGVDVSKSSLHPICTKIARSFVTFDGERKHMKPTDVLNPTGIGNVGKRSKKTKSAAKSLQTTWKDYTCQLFLPLNDAGKRNITDKVVKADSSERLNIIGSIVGVSFVPPGATVGDAVKDLKRDLIQSLHQRFQILTEDAGDSKDIFGNGCQIVLPRRLFCHDTDDNQGNRITFSDYLFPEDSIDDYKERMKDNLDITVEDQAPSSEGHTEKFPTGETSDHFTSDTNDKAPTTSQTKKIVLSLITVAVAALGWVFSGINLSDS